MTTWEKLSTINVNEQTENKQGKTYLSWAWAWGIVKKACPDANYEVVNYEGKPFLFDENLGYLVKTIVTIDNESIPMHLFVMDGFNKAQKATDYTYELKNGTKRTCKAASMFDINTAIMRCLTKNLAMFGLGHYIYAGEDLPEIPPEPLVSSDTVAEIMSISKEINADLGKSLAHCKVNKIEHLTKSQAGSLLRKLKDAKK